MVSKHAIDVWQNGDAKDIWRCLGLYGVALIVKDI